MTEIVILILTANLLNNVIPLLAYSLVLTLIVWVWLAIINRGREILRLFSIDILEVLARYASQKNDQVNRDILFLEADYRLKVLRLELQNKRLALLDALDSQEAQS